MSYAQIRQIIYDSNRLLDETNTRIKEAIQQMEQSEQNQIEAEV